MTYPNPPSPATNPTNPTNSHSLCLSLSYFLWEGACKHRRKSTNRLAIATFGVRSIVMVNSAQHGESGGWKPSPFHSLSLLSAAGLPMNKILRNLDNSIIYDFDAGTSIVRAIGRGGPWKLSKASYIRAQKSWDFSTTPSNGPLQNYYVPCHTKNRYICNFMYISFCILYYSVFCILYSVFCIVYSELCILNSVFCILYSVFCTVQVYIMFWVWREWVLVAAV